MERTPKTKPVDALMRKNQKLKKPLKRNVENGRLRIKK